MGQGGALIHYHGLPITPVDVRNQLAGRNFCVRYGEQRQDDVWAHEHGQSVMLDNGAFSVWTAHREADWLGFYDWCERWLDYPTTWAVIPDVIEGSEEDNDQQLMEWWRRGLDFGRGAPVWHMHEDIDRLKRLCQGYGRVCLGSSAQYAEIGTPQWHRRMEVAMNELCGSGPVPVWLHGLRMMSMAGKHYPFASVDSTNIARNHAGNNDGRPKKSVVAMADRIDAQQCPARWTVREQLEVPLPS